MKQAKYKYYKILYILSVAKYESQWLQMLKRSAVDVLIRSTYTDAANYILEYNKYNNCSLTV